MSRKRRFRRFGSEAAAGALFYNTRLAIRPLWRPSGTSTIRWPGSRAPRGWQGRGRGPAAKVRPGLKDCSPPLRPLEAEWQNKGLRDRFANSAKNCGDAATVVPVNLVPLGGLRGSARAPPQEPLAHSHARAAPEALRKRCWASGSTRSKLLERRTPGKI